MTTVAASSSVRNSPSYAIAQYHALRLGMRREDAEDCAMEFVARLLAKPPPGLSAQAWLHRCAYNHACNYARALARRRQRERSWTERYGANAECRMLAQESSAPGPRTLLLRKELWNQVFRALEQLTPAQRELFIRYHLRGQSVRDLALRFQRTPHALEESLSQARKRLAVLLRNQGWTEADAQTLFRAKSVLPR